jgi:hypothetical protein
LGDINVKPPLKWGVLSYFKGERPLNFLLETSMALARRTVQDFMAQVAAQTNAAGTVVYVASLNADGSVKITRNGVVIYPKVQWGMGVGEALTDANISGDSVTVLDNAGGVGRGDAQQFINSLV